MPQPDLILLRAPSVYDSRKMPFLRAPQSVGETSCAIGMMSFDFLGMANQLEKAGCRARIIDLPYRMTRSKRFYVESFIKKLNAPVFVIELSEVTHAPGALDVAQLIKKHHPASRTILCGCAAARFHNELINRPEVDCVMHGNFERASAGHFVQAVNDGKPGQIPNIAWKDQPGRIPQNLSSSEPASTKLNVAEYYKCVIGQIWHYRNVDGAVLLKRWLRHPIISIFKTGCAGSSLFPNHETSVDLDSFMLPAFREPEIIYQDIVETCRFSPALIPIQGDIRMPGEHYAERLLSLLQHKPVANPLIFEFSDAAPAFFIQEMARAVPGFWLRIMPGSHDTAVRKMLGHSYPNKDLESTIEAALRARAGGIEVLFMVGFPGQTAESVIDTTAYCESLLRQFDGDRRLFLSISPYLLPPDSPVFVKPESYGFEPRFHTFEEYLKALVLPSWKDRLEYQTAEMSAEQIAEATYEALMRLVRLKAKYGQLPWRKAEDSAANYARGRKMVNRLEEIIRGGQTDQLASLKPEIDRINQYDTTPRHQPGLLLLLSRPQNLLALGKAMVNNTRGTE